MPAPAKKYKIAQCSKQCTLSSSPPSRALLSQTIEKRWIDKRITRQAAGGKATKVPRAESLKSLLEEGPLSDNVALDCALSGDVQKLKICFEHPKSQYHPLIHAMMGKRGADDGRTALDWAALLGRADILSILLTNGAEINSINSRGYSALHYACAWGRGECVRLLLEGGASTELLTNGGERAVDTALRYQHGQCVELIELHEYKKQFKSELESTKELVASNSKIFTKTEKVTINDAIKTELDWLVSEEAAKAALCDVTVRKRCFDNKTQPVISCKDLPSAANSTELIQPESEPEKKKTSAKAKKK